LGLFGVRKRRLAAARMTQTSIIAVVSSFKLRQTAKSLDWLGVKSRQPDVAPFTGSFPVLAAEKSDLRKALVKGAISG